MIEAYEDDDIPCSVLRVHIDLGDKDVHSIIADWLDFYDWLESNSYLKAMGKDGAWEPLSFDTWYNETPQDTFNKIAILYLKDITERAYESAFNIQAKGKGG